MLEYKNVIVDLPENRQSSSFSLLVNQGEIACLCGPHGAGKTNVLLATLGLAPVRRGYVTVDGELVTSGSAYYFRQLMAYVPQHVPDGDMTVEEMCRSIFGLRINYDIAYDKNALMSQWKQLDIDESLFSKSVGDVHSTDLQYIMISILPLIRRPIVLLDMPPQSSLLSAFLRNICAQGTEILFTCESLVMDCDSIVNI